MGRECLRTLVTLELWKSKETPPGPGGPVVKKMCPGINPEDSPHS